MQETCKNFSNLVVIFFSETLRSRKISVRRAAEIANRVVEILPKINSEEEVLSQLWEMEKNFEEISSLRQVLKFGYNPSDIKIYEKEVKQYAAEIFKDNMSKSVTFLQDAARENMSIQELCIKYPEFCEYLLYKTQKGSSFLELKPQIA